MFLREKLDLILSLVFKQKQESFFFIKINKKYKNIKGGQIISINYIRSREVTRDFLIARKL